MTDKRPIAPLDLPDLVFGTPPTAKPEITWIAPDELVVDSCYQRDIGEKGRKLIRKLCEGWDWRRYKLPTCVWTDAGLEIVDGQHTVTAACMHPAIDVIPIAIVDAEHVADRAGAFLGVNRDRVAMSSMALHAAAVVAGDPAAAAVERVAAACDVKVLRMPPSGARYRCRETVAVRALADLIKRVGEPLSIEVLRVLAEAELAPITGAALRAAEAILCGEETSGQVDPAELTKAIVTLGPEADREAGIHSVTFCVPKWRGLVAAWFKKAKKRKRESSREELGLNGAQPIENIGADPANPVERNSPSVIASAPPLSPSPAKALSASPSPESTTPSAPSKRGIPPNPRLDVNKDTGLDLHPTSKPGRSRKIIHRKPNPGEAWDFGDPPPGRSALDQDRAKGRA